MTQPTINVKQIRKYYSITEDFSVFYNGKEYLVTTTHKKNSSSPQALRTHASVSHIGVEVEDEDITAELLNAVNKHLEYAEYH